MNEIKDKTILYNNINYARFLLQYNFVTPLTSMVVTTPNNKGLNNVIDPNGK